MVVYTTAIPKNNVMTAMLPVGVSGAWGSSAGLRKSCLNVRRDGFKQGRICRLRDCRIALGSSPTLQGVSKGFSIVVDSALWKNSEVIRKSLKKNSVRLGAFPWAKGSCLGS